MSNPGSMVPATTSPGGRWDRLVADHEQQTARRVEPTMAPWRQRVLGGAVLSMVLLVVIGVGVFQVNAAQRRDPSRCTMPIGAVRAEVGLGGWASPDECSYWDADGQSLHPDHTYAGPVTRSVGDVFDANLWWMGGIALLVPIGGLTTWAVRRRSPGQS